MDKHNTYEIDGNAAKKILPIEQEKQNQFQSMEVMQTVQEEQKEGEIKIPLFMLKQNTNNKHWYYMNLEEHDAEVIHAERERIRKIKYEMKMRKEAERQVKLENFIYFAKQKLFGLGFIIVSLILVKSGLMYDIDTGLNDGTFLIITIPLGLFLLFTKNHCLYDGNNYEDFK